MCCLFGILDCGDALSYYQRTKLLSALAKSSEARGKDATGIAYNAGGLRIYKRPKAAHKMRFHLPKEVHHIMGHTRMTTQGDERLNFNNHPFYGTADCKFALAHNGILHNDDDLRKQLSLPKTHIETDSYVMVQMLEQSGELTMTTLGKMAEQLQGSFTVTVMDDKNNLYVVRGNNPFCLAWWSDLNLYAYASTEEILTQAIRSLPFHLGNAQLIPLEPGDILRIEASGKRSYGRFSTRNLYTYQTTWYWDDLWMPKADTTYIDNLKSVASEFGFTPSDVDELVAEGFAPEQIEAFFYGEEY